MSSSSKSDVPKFGAFNGVFVPTFLSIVGVILFLRLGYIVGNAGILPSIIIVLLAVSVSVATGLSLSAITTNIRIGSGGVFSIISKTLGIEVGGSVGAPLYLALIFSTTLYLFGFSEAWQFMFPEHGTLLVLLASFLLILLLTYFSTKLAIRAQLVIFVVVLLALASLFGGDGWLYETVNTPLIGDFPELGFWGLFALFFPAATGIMAGLGLSGELEDPKDQIPKGILWATAITGVVYLAAVLLIGYSASAQELISNPQVVLDISQFKPLILLGILASTFSSALTTFVAAPRLLQTMADKSLFPGSKLVDKKNRGGIPRAAIVVSSLLIIVTLIFGNLDAVAPIITMFFLLTYAIINVVVFIEQSIGLVSFRPTISISRFIPLYGAVVSTAFIFLINAGAGLSAIVFIFASYLYLVRRRLPSGDGDIRSGLFITFSEWAAKKVLTLPESTKHTWKPNVLLPVIDTRTLLGNFGIIKSITFPNGTMTVLGLDIKHPEYTPKEAASSRKERKSNLDELPKLIDKFGQEGIFTSSSNVTAEDYVEAVTISLEAIEGQTFPPNILFLPFKPKMLSQPSLTTILKTAEKHQVGTVLFDRDTEAGLGSEEDIHIWLPKSAIKHEVLEPRDFDLSMLLAYRLYSNWAGNLNIHMCTSKDDSSKARYFVKRLLYEARLPQSADVHISTQSFNKTFQEVQKGDIHIVPITSTDDTKKVRDISEVSNKSVFFVMDSGKEDILA